MRVIAQVISLITIALVIVPCLLLFGGMLGLEAVKLSALVGTIGWFIATPFWMSRDKTDRASAAAKPDSR